MTKNKTPTTSKPDRKNRPALDPEARQSQLISLAIDLVEQRLIDGTASSQETTHFLRLATQESLLKNKLLDAQAAVAIAKKELLQSQKQNDELVAEAIAAFRNYSGQGDPDEY